MAGHTGKTNIELIREEAEASLISFIKLVHPQRVLGAVHEELISWWCRPDGSTHQLVLLPRDHAKSAMVAYRVAWELTRNPTLRILYISSTANLAIKQLSFIKDILTSKKYRKYWPEMVHPEEGKRKKWTETEIAVDHPLREKEAIRDPSIFAAGLTTGITGMHCDIAVMDDVVVRENAYTKEGRDKVRSQYSMLSSIEGADAQEWIVGTRYDPQDLYNDLMEMVVEEYSEEGELEREKPLYEVFERQVEDVGDGSGEYLWPRQQRYDGKWFGFNQNILSRKKAQYLDKVQFFAQYYNNPNASEDGGVTDSFQYYDKKALYREGGYWWFKDRRLAVFAAIDFAYSLSSAADYTAIVVIGVDHENNIYILDIDRFKTKKVSEYYEHILEAYSTWGFRKMRAEVTAAQAVIVQSLKDDYLRPNGISIVVDEYRPNRHEGTKLERTKAILEPKYTNGAMWHYKGGNCQILEDELRLERPPHDDVKDSLANAVNIAKAPIGSAHRKATVNSNVLYHSRFGGCL